MEQDSRKRNFAVRMCQMSQNRTQNEVFCHFLKFGSLVFLEIAYNNSLQQCLASKRGKINEEKIGAQIWAKLLLLILLLLFLYKK